MTVRIAVVMAGAQAYVKFFANGSCEIEVHKSWPESGAYDAIICLAGNSSGGRPRSPGAKSGDRIPAENSGAGG